MSPNRPFLSNFLAAFRAQSSVRGPVTSSSSTLTSTSSATATLSAGSSQAASNASAATASTTTRTLTTKAGPSPQNATSGPTTGTTTVAIQTSSFQPSRHHTTSPLSLSPGATGGGFGSPIAHSTSSRTRRESDSSNEGFRDTMGAEKWYIGGRTAAGEEKFYKLSMVKRPSSTDRLSIDRMSL